MPPKYRADMVLKKFSLGKTIFSFVSRGTFGIPSRILTTGHTKLTIINYRLMTLFEAGVLSKMTTDEYRNLPEHSRRSEPVTESESSVADMTGDSPIPQARDVII